MASSTNADVKTIRGDKITWVKGNESHCQSIGSLINQVSVRCCSFVKFCHGKKVVQKSPHTYTDTHTHIRLDTRKLCAYETLKQKNEEQQKQKR